MSNRNTVKTTDATENLKQWLNAWYLGQRLDAIAGDEEYTPDGTITSAQLAKLKTMVKAFDQEISSPEIRLLSSELVPDTERPYYVAVMKEWDDDMMLIAPYSSFATPATTGELLTKREHFSLMVLQLWNARTVPTVFLKKSWLVDEMSSEERDEALAVFAKITSGKKMPEELEHRVGLPIVHQKDPRIKYQKQENLLLAPLLDKTFFYENIVNDFKLEKNTSPLLEFAFESIQLPVAAADGATTTSRLIHTEESLVSLFKKCAVKESKLMKMDVARSLEFNPIRPDSEKNRSLLWKMPEDICLKGDELLFVLDSKTNSFIGVGEVLMERKILRLTKISSEFIKRKIDNVEDLLLVVGRI